MGCSSWFGQKSLKFLRSHSSFRFNTPSCPFLPSPLLSSLPSPFGLSCLPHLLLPVRLFFVLSPDSQLPKSYSDYLSCPVLIGFSALHRALNLLQRILFISGVEKRKQRSQARACLQGAHSAVEGLSRYMGLNVRYKLYVVEIQP